ncbi:MULTISPECIES: hypothetical protein [Bacillus cereus group]|nr:MULTISPECIES: hypothetical protein [Bacillus cereus group]MED3025267.1 hypothetical protein [Bacillus wiedmannii]
MIHIEVPNEARDFHKRYIFNDTSKYKCLLTRLKNRTKILSKQACKCQTYFESVKIFSPELCPCILGEGVKRQYRMIFLFIIKNLESIVIGSIAVLKKINSDLYKQYKNLFKNENDQYKDESLKLLSKLLNKELRVLFISTYNSFSSGVSLVVQENGGSKKKVKWGAYEYVKLLGSTVCPYCNAQFTIVIENNGELGKTRPDLDHFLSKTLYPIFAVSLYNLVPSCKICNLSFKGNQNTSFENHFNPYEQRINEYFRFSREFKPGRKAKHTPDYVQAILGESEDFELKIRPSFNENDKKKEEVIRKKVKGNIELFRLNEVYNFHKTHIQKMVLNARVYDNVYRKQLICSFPEIFKSEEELLSLVQYTSEEMKYTILGKMTTDIIKFELLLNSKDTFMKLV